MFVKTFGSFIFNILHNIVQSEINNIFFLNAKSKHARTKNN